MQIILNGSPHKLDKAITVSELLADLELNGRLAVEINQQIIPRSLFNERKLNQGDNVEIVHAIGGG